MNTNTADTDIRIVRMTRLLRGARADLASAEASQAAGWMGFSDRPIETVVADGRKVVAMWEAKLRDLGVTEP